MARPKCYETNAEKQKAYRHRKKGGDATSVLTQEITTSIGTSEAAPTVQSSGAAFETKKVGEFRMLVMPERVEDEPTIPVEKPLIFRDDNGRVISERAWNALQKLKEKAKGIYEIDDYIQ